MPKYRFLSQRQREQLIGALTAAIEQDPRYAGYLEGLKKLNQEMDRLYQSETDRSRPDAGLPHSLTKEEAAALREMLFRLASEGEALLAAAERAGKPAGTDERF